MAVETAIPLDIRIKQRLRRSKAADPEQLAERLRPTLSSEEEEELIAEALHDRVLSAFHALRAAAFQGQRQALLPSNSKKAHDRKEAIEVRSAERLVTSLRNPVTAAIRDAATAQRAALRRLSLSLLYQDRVCVRGEWKLLGECTVEDCRALAEDYTTRAIAQAERGSFYLAIAEEMTQRGCEKVADLCQT